MNRIARAFKRIDPFAILAGFIAGVFFTSLMSALPQLPETSIGDVTPANNVTTFVIGFFAGITHTKTHLACVLGLTTVFLALVGIAFARGAFVELNQTHFMWAVVATTGLTAIGGKTGAMINDLSKPKP